LVVTLLGWPGLGMAESIALTSETLRQAVSGKTVYLATSVGALPISYKSNELMTGKARELAPYVGSDRDQGNWWVADNRLCQRWDNWLYGKKYCYKLRMDGKTVYWQRNDGRSGTAMITSQ
jgi:hypothetical protein